MVIRIWQHAVGAVALTLVSVLAGVVHAAQVKVAVASNFSLPMRKIATAFAQATGHEALLAVGSTGTFYAQIKRGAPFEVLLSADALTPARLEKEGYVQPGSRFTYAIGRLVLWSRQAGLVDGRGEVLRDSKFARWAMADPKLAPYGAAAEQTLHRLGLWQALQSRQVLGENIAQTYHFVATGNAALGFVALSQVMQAGGAVATGSAWVVPAHLHEPIRQDAALLLCCAHNPAAIALMAYLKSPAAQAIIRAHGYEF